MRRPPDDVPMNWLIATWHAFVLIVWTLALLPPALIGRLLLGRAAPAIVRLWHRGACRIIGLDLSTAGRPSAGSSALFVANHISYVDILVLGSCLDARFIAKSDVERWPIFGFLARLTGTVFIERRAKRSGDQRDMLERLLASGERLILFAEGTSSDGSTVLPFKSSLFGALEADQLKARVDIQPVTIGYASADHAWYGDMTLMPHLWRVLGLGGARVCVQWHGVMSPDRWTGRKDLARQLHAIVADGLVAMKLCGDRVGEVAGQEAGEIALGGAVHGEVGGADAKPVG